MIGITIKIQNQAQFEQKLRAIGVELMNLKPELSATGQKLVDYFSVVPFVTKGSNYGTPWPELNPSYKLWKMKEYPQSGQKILVRQGFMQNSFGFKPSNDFLSIFNTKDYFEKHQLGIGVPQRAVFGINAEVTKIISQTIEDGIQAKINRVK